MRCEHTLRSLPNPWQRCSGILADFQPLAKMAVVYATFIINTLQNSLIPVILANSDPRPLDAPQSSTDVWHPLYRMQASMQPKSPNSLSLQTHACMQAWKDFVVCLEMVLLSLLISKAFPFQDMCEYNLLKPNQVPTIDLGADNYVDHRVEEAANTLRAVSSVNPAQMRLQRQTSLVSRQSPASDWFGLSQLRRRFSRESSIRSPAPLDLVVPHVDEDQGVPMQFLSARANSIRHIHSLSMLVDFAGESGTDAPIRRASSLETPASNADKGTRHQATDGACPVTIVAFEESAGGQLLDVASNKGEGANILTPAFRPAAVIRQEASLGGLENLDNSIFERADVDDSSMARIAEGDSRSPSLTPTPSPTPLPLRTRHETLRRDSAEPAESAAAATARATLRRPNSSADNSGHELENDEAAAETAFH